MLIRELMEMLCNYAKDYCPTAKESIIRNRHMNKLNGVEVSQNIIDALIVDFINFVGAMQNVDLGFYTKDLKKVK